MTDYIKNQIMHIESDIKIIESDINILIGEKQKRLEIAYKNPEAAAEQYRRAGFETDDKAADKIRAKGMKGGLNKKTSKKAAAEILEIDKRLLMCEGKLNRRRQKLVGLNVQAKAQEPREHTSTAKTDKLLKQIDKESTHSEKKLTFAERVQLEAEAQKERVNNPSLDKDREDEGRD